MPREVNETNLREAYCKSIACTAVGAAESDCDAVLPKAIKLVVPQAMHPAYATTLKACVVKICTAAPYHWTVNDVTPAIGDTTTFQSLYDTWFKMIVFA